MVLSSTSVFPIFMSGLLPESVETDTSFFGAVMLVSASSPDFGETDAFFFDAVMLVVCRA